MLTPELNNLYNRLVLVDMDSQLPGHYTNSINKPSLDNINILLSNASDLAFSNNSEDRNLAYDITTRIVRNFRDKNPAIVFAAETILARLGNFPGRELLRKRFQSENVDLVRVPAYAQLEIIARSIENSVAESKLPLTDFQRDIVDKLDAETDLSISAPTSAGKSFALILGIIRKIKKKPCHVVYIVPTRTLIRQTIAAIGKMAKLNNLADIPTRCIPIPFEEGFKESSFIYVLTQERLLTLLSSASQDFYITDLIIDEAQGIRDGSRGVLLQSAIEFSLRQFPQIKVVFASPLIENPKFFFELVDLNGIEHLDNHSPVSQNIILVKPKKGYSSTVILELILSNNRLSLGERELERKFSENASLGKRRAIFAQMITPKSGCTIIYANRPDDAEKTAFELQSLIGKNNKIHSDVLEFIEFLKESVHEEYPLIKCLESGVAFHYGEMPGIVKIGIEELVEEGKIRYICATSTLLQGVNLPSRDIIIENPRLGNGNPMTRASFLNLAGRAGRLLKEFHGNVWCLFPDSWDSSAFEGKKLTEVKSAFKETLRNGASLVLRVLGDGTISEGERQLGVTTFGKIYADYYLSNNWDSLTLPNEESKTAFESIHIACEAIPKLLPEELYKKNPTILPQDINNLYLAIAENRDINSLVPIAPFTTDTNKRLSEIFECVSKNLFNDKTRRYSYYAMLASEWIHQNPLKAIIQNRINYLQGRGQEFEVGDIIQRTISDIEKVIRYKYVTGIRVYLEILAFLFQTNGNAEYAERIIPVHLFLECGASNPKVLALIGLGLSRATAIAVEKYITIAITASTLDYMAVLKNINVSRLRIPKACKKEILFISGRL